MQEKKDITMRKIRWIGMLVAIGVLGFLGGMSCIKFTRVFPEKKTYLLELPPATKGSVRFANTILKMRRFSISSRYDGKSFVYRKTDANYETDFYNEFLIPPQNNIGEEMIRYLEGKNLFRFVGDMSSRIEATHLAEVEIVSLYGDYRNSRSFAILELQIRVFDDRLGDYKPIWRKNYAESISVNGDNPESLVLGWNQCLVKVLDSMSKEFQGIAWEKSTE